MPAFDVEIHLPKTPRTQNIGISLDAFETVLASSKMLTPRSNDCEKASAMEISPEPAPMHKPPARKLDAANCESKPSTIITDRDSGAAAVSAKLDLIIEQLDANLTFTKALYKKSKRGYVDSSHEPKMTRTYGSQIRMSKLSRTSGESKVLSNPKCLNGDAASCGTGTPDSRSPPLPAKGPGQRASGNTSKHSAGGPIRNLGTSESLELQAESVLSDSSKSSVSPSLRHNSNIESEFALTASNGSKAKTLSWSPMQACADHPSHSMSAFLSSKSQTKSVRIGTISLGYVSERWRDVDRILIKERSAMFLLWRFMSDNRSSVAAFVYDWCLNIFFIVTVLLSFLQILDTNNPFMHHFSRDADAMWRIHIAIEFSFAVELAVRFACCPNKVLFWASPYNIIDMMSWLPGVLRLIIITQSTSDENAVNSKQVIALLGVVPVLRLLKLLRRFETFQLLLACFENAIQSLPVLFYTMFVMTMTFAAIIYYVETRENMPTMLDSIYFVMVTLTTVGYGDTYPTTTLGKIVASMLMCIGPLYMAIPIGIVGHSFTCTWEDRHRLLLIHRMRTSINQAGYEPVDIFELFKIFDKDQDGLLDYDEFSSMLRVIQSGVSDKTIAEAFEFFDWDDEGAIAFEGLHRGLFPKRQAGAF